MRPIVDASRIDQVLGDASIRTVFQPIVDLDARGVVAYEALSRGPAGSPLERPDLLFAAARDSGRQLELDELCLSRAIDRAVELPPGCGLFVNVEPSTLTSAVVGRTAPIAAAGDRTVVLEVTERAIDRAPATLLAGIAAAREHGWLVALDDVGVEAASLAFLPVIRPDVIKLDMGLIHGRPDRDLGRTMAAVMAESERRGTVVLAEGIESDEHVERAISLGASLGQGFHFGRPADAQELDGGSVQELAIRPVDPGRTIALSPYDAVVATGQHIRSARKDVLLQISHHLEEQAGADPGTPMVLSAFQHARHFTAATARRYARLAERCALVAALGVDMAPAPVPGVRGGLLIGGDPLAGEWSVVVLGPHYAGALLAKDLGDSGDSGDSGVADGDRRFDYVVTHDRSLVELAAESLLRRVALTESVSQGR
ncbi:sensor domain-containing phosphodiesterase [Dermatobacter hominis]|uniref:sensor domain-containing phosphodiesterase n=1 Tax=Dermatobacter hominis TaxID=2884263 RepID=UPI001D10B332|nr:EAL domain-containing protein [Dermatobacter hominis]UDY37592.1 EAL domain-containing protein [Dermatobacter hominis]